jgi:hypothetical protein
MGRDDMLEALPGTSHVRPMQLPKKYPTFRLLKFLPEELHQLKLSNVSPKKPVSPQSTEKIDWH